LISRVVHTVSATAAAAVGDAEQREELVIPPSGSLTPWVEEETPATTTALVALQPGFQLCRAALVHIAEVSWQHEPPTRCRHHRGGMNSASNMIAKWTRNGLQPGAAEDSGEDLRHADGQRRRSPGSGDQVCSPTALARGEGFGGIAKPRLFTRRRGGLHCAASTPAGAFIA